MHPHVVRMVCTTPVANLASLRDRVTQVWMAQEAPEVRHICRGFKRRLEAVITAEGGHIDLYGRTPCGAHFYFMRRAQKSP